MIIRYRTRDHALGDPVFDLRGIERGGKPRLLAVIARALPELGTADAGRAVPADEIAVGVLAEQVIED